VAETFVLVHGAYHGSWCWELLTPELEARGKEVLAVDLPIGEPQFGAAQYAETIEAAVDGLTDPILVGHSMAGLVLPLVATNRDVGMLIFLAALLPQPGLSCQAQRANEPIDAPVEFETAEFTTCGEGVWTVGPNTAIEMFYHDVPDETARWAVGRLRPQAYTFMHEITPLQKWPATERAYILCAEDRAVNPNWARRAVPTRLGVQPSEIEGGHSPFLSRPAELAELLCEIA
jgi:pimeloyl-ACP methyl ester carboxylesterase